MLCAGATVYEPLKEHGAARPGKRVGVVGLGGLGHLGVLFAKAMGCEHVVAVSRREDKREDAVKLGADGYIATVDEEGWAETHAASLDLIICTVSDPRMPLMKYLGLLRPKGVFCQVGIPEGPLPQLDTMALVLNGTSVCFSDSASPGNVREMLNLAAEKGVRAWTECRPMEEINSVIKEMEEGRARFRYVMVNEGSEKGIQKTE
jgi:alcohol dehydrogenase (NADP+)